MPTYEYECKSCGYSFETFQSMTDAPLTVCPECGKEVRRLINGGSGIIFKGSGFYITDKKSNANDSKSTPETKNSTQTKQPNNTSVGDSPVEKVEKTGKTEKVEKSETG
jgi:putative FmdB family regulatory protein